MKTIEVCPSTLRPGFSAYSPQAVKELFDGVVVSCMKGQVILAGWTSNDSRKE